MLISIITPCYRAESFVGRMVRSLQKQTYADWEAVLVADDGVDYEQVLRAQGLQDSRLHFASTGHVKSGCHHGRNVGLEVAKGDFITFLDADDAYLPRRLEVLLPIAMQHGAAADNLVVLDDSSGQFLRHPLDPATDAKQVTAEDMFNLHTPMFPLTRRDCNLTRLPGVEFCEDIIGNLRLMELIGPVPLVPEPLMEYRVVMSSMCHNPDAAQHFDTAYAAYIERLTMGDGFGLQTYRALALQGFRYKQSLNRAFAVASQDHSALTFQDFILRGIVPFRALPV